MKRKVPLWLWQLWQYRIRHPVIVVTLAQTARFIAPAYWHDPSDSLLRGLGEGESETSWSAAREALERLKRSGDHL